VSSRATQSPAFLSARLTSRALGAALALVAAATPTTRKRDWTVSPLSWALTTLSPERKNATLNAMMKASLSRSSVILVLLGHELLEPFGDRPAPRLELLAEMARAALRPKARPVGVELLERLPRAEELLVRVARDHG